MPASSSLENASYAAETRRLATSSFFDAIALCSAIAGFVWQQHAMGQLDSGEQHQLHVLQQDSNGNSKSRNIEALALQMPWNEGAKHMPEVVDCCKHCKPTFMQETLRPAISSLKTLTPRYLCTAVTFGAVHATTQHATAATR
jgi:hypothetical protein